MSSRRFSAERVDRQAATVSRMLGVEVIAFRAYGGTGVHLVHPDTSHTDLMPCETAREASRFLAGMIAAASLLAQEQDQAEEDGGIDRAAEDDYRAHSSSITGVYEANE